MTRQDLKTSSPPDGADIVRFAITLSQPNGEPGLFKAAETPMGSALKKFMMPDDRCEALCTRLAQMGITVRGKGRFAITATCSAERFREIFGTELATHRVPTARGANRQLRQFLFPAEGASWNPSDALGPDLDDAYIQWPHLYFNSLFESRWSGLPPDAHDHHLRIPGDVSMLLNASRAHRAGVTGRGVRVAMIDTGFAHDHPHFEHNGYKSRVVLAPGAADAGRDGNGHGTAESANLFAIAPDIEFIGIKLENEANPQEGATVLEGFQAAVAEEPQVISISLGYDLVPTDQETGQRLSNMHLTSLPKSIKTLEAEIRAAVDDGIVVVVSAGNGQVAFPGMMPEVLSVGGVHVGRSGTMRASDYASAFASRIYADRHVPDVSGLVGLAANNARYIMLPVEPEATIDLSDDGTHGDDGWAVISGTSAAAPQVAGTCALLLERDSSLTPGDVKQILARSARSVTFGAANPASNEYDGGLAASADPDGATGYGLVDAFAGLNAI